MVEAHIPSVLICTPCYGGLLTVEYMRGLERIRSCLDQHAVRYDILLTEGESNVNRARNLMVGQFMQTDYDVLAFIDADIEFFKGEDFLDLLKFRKGVRGAAVSMKTKDGRPALSAWKNGEMLTRNLMVEPHIPVEFLGAAVLMVERTHFETLWSKHTSLLFHDDTVGECCALFECLISRGVYLSEDYGFCQLARDAGIGIFAAGRVIVGHSGRFQWQG